MKNLEQKFRCGDLAGAEAVVRKLGATDRGIIAQHDYFFPAPLSRLKLRLINGHEAAELIAYRRPDAEGPTTSDFSITPIAHPDALLETLTKSLGKPRELIKTRRLFIYKSTRIHIDKVEGVKGGDGFVELEALMTQNSPEAARAELEEVVRALGLKEAVAVAYVDLLE